MKSSQIALLAFLSILYSSTSLAQANNRLRIWESLQATDSEFAERSRSLGINQAYLDTIGKNAVVFRRGPVDAFSVYSRIDPDDRRRATLELRANYIEFSAAGDLGLTAGPYRHSVGSGEELRRTHGHFVTIWRNVDGEWRNVADMIVRIPGVLSLDVEADRAETEYAIDETASPLVTAANTLESLQAAEDRFISAINYRGGRRAIQRYGLESQRIYVPGMAPGIGSDSGSTVYGAFLDERMALAIVTYKPGGAFMASSGDLGYTYGTMSAEESGFNTSYLRLWRFTELNEWKIAVEVLNPY